MKWNYQGSTFIWQYLWLLYITLRNTRINISVYNNCISHLHIKLDTVLVYNKQYAKPMNNNGINHEIFIVQVWKGTKIVSEHRRSPNKRTLTFEKYFGLIQEDSRRAMTEFKMGAKPRNKRDFTGNHRNHILSTLNYLHWSEQARFQPRSTLIAPSTSVVTRQ